MSKQTFTIGTDAEFWAGKSGYAFTEVTEKYLGLDGGGVVLETRAAYSENPLEVVKNIRDLFIGEIRENPEIYNNTWKAGGFTEQESTGGHIHLGYSDSSGLDPDDIANLMESYVGVTGLLIEKRSEGMKRRSCDYGLYGSHRLPEHGIELRSLSSWLVSPVIAAAILSLTKVVFNEVLNNGLRKEFVTETEFNKMKTPILRKRYNEIWGGIQKMELYNQYKNNIQILKYLIDKELCWYPKLDMKSAWGLVNPVNNIKLSLKDIWS